MNFNGSIPKERHIVMRMNFKYSLSKDILYIVKRYDKADTIERIRLNTLFHDYAFYFWYYGRITMDEFRMLMLLYDNLINRRLGLISHFCEKAYYPKH